MSTVPLWQAGHQYVPGDLVQPVQAPAASLSTLTNGGFESGSTSWSLPGGASIETDHAYSGSNRCKFTGSAGDIRLENTTLAACSPGTTISASCMYQQGGADAGDNVGTICLIWYDSGSVELSETLGVAVSSGSNDEWHPSTISATAPAGTAYVAVGFHVDRTDGSESSSIDQFSWDLVSGGGTGGLIYRAVQADPGFSGETEPAWPSTLGVTVVDNEVTWEAVQASRVTWEAHPILVSGATEPTWPTTPGAKVVNGTIAFECISRRVEDEKCPNSKIVAIMAGKVFAGDGDIVRYCSTGNPLDWQAANDAGYLPTGLQQANANEIAVLAPYRSNLAAMNPECFQAWQIDPDPALMSLLDQMDGVGSGHQRAACAVANDLFYLSNRGVRSVAISVGAENLAAGDIGVPIDVLVQAALADAIANDRYAISTWYPGQGQFWLVFRDAAPTIDPLVITGTLDDGTIGTPYSSDLTVSGGTPPYANVSISAGSLPPGLSIALAGATITVSGTPT